LAGLASFFTAFFGVIDLDCFILLSFSVFCCFFFISLTSRFLGYAATFFYSLGSAFFTELLFVALFIILAYTGSFLTDLLVLAIL
jgi:hypothetical protein